MQKPFEAIKQITKILVNYQQESMLNAFRFHAQHIVVTLFLDVDDHKRDHGFFKFISKSTESCE